MRASIFVAALLISVSGLALAQDRQEVVAPRTVYWMSATTGSGMIGMRGGMDALAMARGGVASSTTLNLEIASQDRPTRGGVEATHTVPAAARLGPDLRLGPNGDVPREPGTPGDDFEQPRGRLFLFYGCGERAGRGQPIVIDFARVAAGQMPAGLESRVTAARTPNPPSERGWPSVAFGPRFGMMESNTTIPRGGSIVGDHRVRSSMASDIRFSLASDYDVLAPIAFSRNAPNPSGSVGLAWSAIPRATGYALAAFAQGDREGDMVYWSSSAVQTWDASVMQFLAPDEAARLVRERVLLAPSTTECTVPLEAARAMGVGSSDEERGGMLFMTAFGPEANFVDPARPSDPRTPWRQNWAAKVRLNSVSVDGLGRSMMAGMTDIAGAMPRDPLTETAPPSGMSQQAWCQERAQARRSQQGQSGGSAVGEAIGGATGIPGAGMAGRALGGMLGRNRNPSPPADPYCPT